MSFQLLPCPGVLECVCVHLNNILVPWVNAYTTKYHYANCWEDGLARLSSFSSVGIQCTFLVCSFLSNQILTHCNHFLMGNLSSYIFIWHNNTMRSRSTKQISFTSLIIWSLWILLFLTQAQKNPNIVILAMEMSIYFIPIEVESMIA